MRYYIGEETIIFKEHIQGIENKRQKCLINAGSIFNRYKDTNCNQLTKSKSN